MHDRNCEPLFPSCFKRSFSQTRRLLILASKRMRRAGREGRGRRIKVGGSNWIKISSRENGCTVLQRVLSHDATLSRVFASNRDIMTLKRRETAESDRKND